jgi:Protein of unknown function (DUF3501)
MKKVQRSELLDLGGYEQIRAHFRARVIAEKKHRRLDLGDELSVVFENHDTVLFQIQEMLRTERITTEAAIAHEIETYNDLVAGPDELSATLFVEIPDKEIRDRRLVELVGLERSIALEVKGQSIRAQFDPRGVLPDRTLAVHYLKFPLGPGAAARWTAAGADVAVVIDHPRLSLRVPLPPPVFAALAADLAA